MAAKTAKKRATPVRTIIHPFPPPDEATHFRLKKDGTRGETVIWTDEHGIDRQDHPISLFTKDAIVSRSGYHRHYCVQFSRQVGKGRESLGAYRRLGLPDPRDAILARPADPDPVTELVPALPAVGASFNDSLAGLRVLKEITQADAERARQDAAARIDSDRNFMTKTLEILTALRGPAAPASATADPAIAAGFAAMTAQMQAIATRLEALEEEEEEDETEEEKIERVVAAAKKDGLAALGEYFGGETVEGVIRALPTLSKRIPEIIKQAAPIIQAKVAEMTAALAAANAAQQQAPAPAPLPAAAPPPKKRKPVHDEHSVSVK